MELRLPELTSLNKYIRAERGNRYVAAKIKKAETEIVAWLAKSQLKPVEKINKITFIWQHKNKKKDMDNVEFCQKWIWDGLVMAGIIPNDTWRYRPTRTLHKHEINKKGPGCVVIIK